jgi:hypothetical protein
VVAGSSRRIGAALVVVVASRALVAAADTPPEPVEALRAALRLDDPAARAAAVREAGRGLSRLPDPVRRKAALLLRKPFDDDPSGPVRREVVRLLAALRDDVAWIPVLRATLSDRDADVSAAARRATLTARSDLLPVVARLLKEDEDPAFRADLLLLLGHRQKRDAVPLLLESLSASHARVAAAAAEALEAVTGQALGYDAAAWRAWAAKAPPPPSPPPSGETVTVETPADPDPPPPPPPPRSLVPTFFGLSLEAKDLVFVIDVSGSVGETGFQHAKSELMDAAERLGSDVRFGALFFDDDVRMWRPDLVRASPAAKGELALFLRGIPRGKRTDVMTALNAGLQVLRTRSAERRAANEGGTTPVTMIVVSDGVETVRRTPIDTVGDKLDRLDLRDTVIHSVVLGGKDSALLAALARRTGGRYVVAP